MMAEAASSRLDGLQLPHGNKLVNLQVPEGQWDAVIKTATKTMEASDRNACDVELLSVGGFSPLEGFMNQEDFESVVSDMRLKASCCMHAQLGENSITLALQFWSGMLRLLHTWTLHSWTLTFFAMAAHAMFSAAEWLAFWHPSGAGHQPRGYQSKTLLCM